MLTFWLIYNNDGEENDKEKRTDIHQKVRKIFLPNFC